MRRVLRVKIPQTARFAKHLIKKVILLEFHSGILPSKYFTEAGYSTFLRQVTKLVTKSLE